MTTARINIKHYKFDGFTYVDRHGDKFCGSPVGLLSVKTIRGKLFQKYETGVSWYKLGNTIQSEALGLLGPKSKKIYWENNAKTREHYDPSIKVRRTKEKPAKWVVVPKSSTAETIT